MELIDQITKSLGVSEAQAQGGVGMIFKQAQSKLSSEEFTKVANVVPGIEGLIKGAPSAGGGFLSKIFGGGGGIASLAGGFSKLGLDSGMIGKFLPIILSFVQAKGGDGVKGILEKVLK